MKQKIVNNLFFKVFSYNSIVVLVKFVTAFVVSKVSAIFLGPSGYALVGNLKNILQGVLGVTSTGFQSGVIKYVAENKTDKRELKVVVSSVIFLCIIISCIVSVFVYVFSGSLSIYVLKEASYSIIFKWLALLLPLVSLSFLTVYLVNGLQKFKLYTFLVSLSNILNALITFILIYYYNLEGALFASILVPALNFLLGFIFKEIRDIYILFFRNYKYISIGFVKSISVYLMMAVYSSILISFSYLLVRNEIIESIDLFNAGLWESMNKVSSFYMVFFSSLFTLYLLPQLTVNETVTGYYSIMKNYFKYLIPFMILVFLILFLFRVFLIKIVLTEEFKSIEQFFLLQFFGDFIKIIAFSLAYQFHAKKMVKFYIISDFVLYVSFYVLSLYLLEYFSLVGVFYAYIVSTILYFLFVLIFVLNNNSKYLESHAK